MPSSLLTFMHIMIPSADRKVQTIKDLEKPWKELALSPAHTATSTLLMDDSPLKTRLQPYNHLCVLEYTKNIRNMDRRAHKERSSLVSSSLVRFLSFLYYLEKPTI